MKIRNIFILTALFFTVLFLGACGSWDGSDQGSIIINFGNSGARYIVSDGDKAEMIYTVTLTSPGKTAIETKTAKGAESISIQASEGAWNIQVKAEGNGNRITKGEGEANAAVAAGISASVNIEMKVTGTRVHNWEEIKADFEDKDMANEYSIEIVSDADIDVGPNNYITISNGKVITLWSEKPVTIKRTNDRQASYNQTIFYVHEGTLILDGTKGEITFKGNGKDNTNCSRALINVDQKDGILKMLAGITLTDNHTEYGGGVYVKYGSFYMEGGVIAGNSAKRGGGVYIADLPDGGTFVKNGGTIYGSEKDVADVNKNSSSDTGDAVYDGSITKNSNETLVEKSPDGDWPR